MRFKTKDLLVSVQPNREIDEELVAKLCIWHTRICVRPTFHCRWPSFQCHPCTLLPSFCACSNLPSIPCGGGSCFASGCDPSLVPCGPSRFVIEDPSDLVTLRKELDDVVKQLDTLRKEGLPGELSTSSEFDAAEKALEGALAELRRQKKSAKK